MSAKAVNVLELTRDKLEEIFKKYVATISEETTKSIEAYNNARYEAQNRFKSYYNRKKFIDMLIYINLFITPILVGYLAYIQIIKGK